MSRPKHPPTGQNYWLKATHGQKDTAKKKTGQKHRPTGRKIGQKTKQKYKHHRAKTKTHRAKTKTHRAKRPRKTHQAKITKQNDPPHWENTQIPIFVFFVVKKKLRPEKKYGFWTISWARWMCLCKNPCVESVSRSFFLVRGPIDLSVYLSISLSLSLYIYILSLSLSLYLSLFVHVFVRQSLFSLWWPSLLPSFPCLGKRSLGIVSEKKQLCREGGGVVRLPKQPISLFS